MRAILSEIEQEQHVKRSTQVCFALRSLATAIDQDCAARLMPYGLSEGKFTVLAVLCRANDLSPNEIAARAGVTKATITGLLDGLERDGYLSRQSDKADRRRLSIVLSDKGRKITEELIHDQSDWMNSLMCALTEEEEKQLEQIINKIWNNLRNDDQTRHNKNLMTGTKMDKYMFMENGTATIRYTIEGNGPFVFLVGAPVGIDAFAPLSKHLAPWFTVVRHDPRGIGGSTWVADDAVTPNMLADDLLKLIDFIAGGSAYVFGQSGGAVSGLALLERAPSAIKKLVAHEAPLFGMLPDASEIFSKVDNAFALAQSDPDAGMQDFANAVEIMHETFESSPRPQPGANARPGG